jgi:diketogulonate reductase-like aldo/keto reductase
MSKAWGDDYEHIEEACLKSIKKLGVEYLDLYFLHWPVATRRLPNTEEVNEPSSYERINIPMHKVWP